MLENREGGGKKRKNTIKQRVKSIAETTAHNKDRKLVLHCARSHARPVLCSPIVRVFVNVGVHIH